MMDIRQEILNKDFQTGIRPSISVIYVNYNSMNLIIESLYTVIKNTVSNYYEIIIVDNHSARDDCKQMFEHLLYSIELPSDNKLISIKLILSPDNLGFGKGNNLAIQYARSDVFFFLNPDTLLVNGAIDLLYHSLCSIPNCGAVGPNLYDRNMKPNYSYSKVNIGICADLNRLFAGIPYKLLQNMTFNTTNDVIKVKMIMGASLMMKKEILADSYFFDPDFEMFFEETEMCSRILAKGYGLYNVPVAKIIHFEGGSFTEVPESREILYLKGRRIFYRKIYSDLYKQVSDALLLLTYFSKILIHYLKPVDRHFWKKRFVLLKNNL